MDNCYKLRKSEAKFYKYMQTTDTNILIFGRFEKSLLYKKLSWNVYLAKFSRQFFSYLQNRADLGR